MPGIMDKIGGLLANPRTQDFATGLLAQSGYSATPTTFGQALGGATQFAQTNQAQRMQLQAARQKMEDDKNRRDAQEQIQSLLQVPPAIRTPQAPEMMQGLLAQANPEMFTKGLIEQQFGQAEAPRVSTDLNTFRALNPGVAPGSPQERALYADFLQAKDPTGGLMQQAQLELTMTELANAREERLARAETATQETQGTRRAVVQDLRHLGELADLNDRLEGTALETGLPMPELRRAAAGGIEALQSLFGGDTRKAARIKADFDRFNKLTTDFVVGSMDRLNGSGAITNSKFDALVGANANVGSSPGANRLIFADNIEAILDGAEIAGFEVSGAADFRKRAQALRGGQSPEPNPTANQSLVGLESLLQRDPSTLTEDEAGRILQWLERAGP